MSETARVVIEKKLAANSLADHRSRGKASKAVPADVDPQSFMFVSKCQYASAVPQDVSLNGCTMVNANTVDRSILPFILSFLLKPDPSLPVQNTLHICVIIASQKGCLKSILYG
eukprot:TRINITY_DN1740_c0_g7_i3.p1 TRINITY_DN1740_c0_g7~~TRINITY_DN1740_c0_g7_i3.p1  ORF type:complete len:114 (-),score=2.08 TRINITY_DN1740_c0_g7_i3:52-393(-)